MNDLTVIYYTSNTISQEFYEHTKQYLLLSIGDTPLISVSFKPMELGENIVCENWERSHLNIYRQALIGAKQAKTKYIAMAEDDILYVPEHFKYRPHDGVFAYDKHFWSIYTWVKPALFSYKDRLNLNALICERDLFINAMEERFAKYPDDSTVSISSWAEPGRYESNLGFTVQKTETYYADKPFIAFSHPDALGFLNLGTRKKLGILRAKEIPDWGRAEEVVKLYA